MKLKQNRMVILLLLLLLLFSFNCYFYFILFIFELYLSLLCLRVMPRRYYANLRSQLQPHSALVVAETALILFRVEGLFGRTLLYGYDLRVAAILPSADPDHSFLQTGYIGYDDDEVRIALQASKNRIKTLHEKGDTYFMKPITRSYAHQTSHLFSNTINHFQFNFFFLNLQVKTHSSRILCVSSK